jgi:hypothetical protein
VKLALTGASWRAGATGAAAAIAAVVVIAAIGYGAGWRLNRPAPAASCQVDTAIDASARQVLDRVALDFVAAAAGKNPGRAYDMLATAPKSAISKDKFIAALHASVDAVAPFSNVNVAHSYFVEMPPGAAAQHVSCGAAPDEVMVSAIPLPQQAHIVVASDTSQGQWDFVLWLVPENGWRVAGFDVRATAMGGKSLSALIATAREQHAAHHDFNAVLLYGAAAHLAERGANLQLAIEPTIQRQLAALPVPAYLRGKAPLHWRIDGDDFTIDNIGAAGAGDKLYVAITQELSPWHDDADADTRNRLLISDFARAAPEYAASFSGVIVLARDHSGSHLYRTVATGEAQAKVGK